jgi:glycosyltransferase involved in cell wall biosynthesis
LFFGNIVKYKGLDLLISALEGLRARGIENITLTIAGRGEDLDYCRSLMRTKEIYRLLPRFIENSEVPGLMCSHHFLVLPYRDSTQSGPLLIAANYGVPVLAPRNGCFTEVYDDDSAVLYDTLEDGLQRVSALSDDSYEAIRSKASAIREQFSEEAIAEKYCAYFDSLCGRE